MCVVTDIHENGRAQQMPHPSGRHRWSETQMYSDQLRKTWGFVQTNLQRVAQLFFQDKRRNRKPVTNLRHMIYKRKMVFVILLVIMNMFILSSMPMILNIYILNML